jgi:hypothetical protein
MASSSTDRVMARLGALAQGYDRLSTESQFHRFLTGTPHLSEALLDRLVDGVDGVDHVALVLFLLDDQGVGTPPGRRE